jgi:CrcB protein
VSPLAPRSLTAVALGGALGSVLRWVLGEVAPDDGAFPWTTLAINVSGSLALALLLTSAAVRSRPTVALGLGPGLLGGFTTLSAYAEQGRALLAEGDAVLALAYLLGTLAAAVAAVTLVARTSGRPA